MNWDLTGKQVNGRYLNQFKISGIVLNSRVKYGGQVQNEIKLDTPITVYGAVRETVLMDTKDLVIV